MNDAALAQPVYQIDVRYLPLPRFCELYGYTANAVRVKIHRGQWIEGMEFRYDPDGKIQIITAGYNRWVERGKASRHGVRASASRSAGTAPAAAKL